MSEERDDVDEAQGSGKQISWLAALALVALTVWVFAPVSGFEFVEWDDDQLIFENQMMSKGLSAETALWALTAFEIGNWAPVAWLTHLADVSLYGLEAPGHHVTSLIIHVANTVLLFLGLVGLTGLRGRSLVVAALFAVHPLHTESVAWVAERRDVLSMFFALLAFGAHTRWARDRSKSAYLACLLALALGLTSKAMLVSMPLLLLFMDYWPLRRSAEGIVPLLVEKIPHTVLVGIVIIVTLVTQAKVQIHTLPLAQRLSNSIASYWIYLGQTIWPQNLAVLYPHPVLPGGLEPMGVIATVVGGLLLVAASAAALMLRQRPYVAVGWFWYVVSLVPVIGLVQVGQQAHADRYTYLPLIGIFVALTWGVGDVLERFVRDRTWGSRVVVVATVVVISCCALVAREQVGHWRNSITLFEHATLAVPGNFQMHYMLALTLKDAGEVERSIEHYRKAVEINPTMARAHFNLANSYYRLKRWDEAIVHYEHAANDDAMLTRAMRGLMKSAHQRDGNMNAFVSYVERRAQARPDSVTDQILLGHTHRMNGNPEGALAAYRSAIAIDPDDAEVRKMIAETERALEKR